MKKHPLAIVALSVLSLVACGKSGSDSSPAAVPAAVTTSTTPAATTGATASETSGSIDFAIKAETINGNSKGDSSSHQCQLAFVATNNSSVDVASMIIEFDALPAGGGAPVGGKLNLTMPMAVKSGASQEAWGNVTVDNVACDALQLSFPPQPAMMCRTSTKVPCAAYRFKAEGVAIAG